MDLDLQVLGTDDAGAGGVRETERVADRDHDLTQVQRVGIAQFDGSDLFALGQQDLQERQVVVARRAEHLDLEFTPVGQRDLDLMVVGLPAAFAHRRIDDVPVADGEARLVDDHAGALAEQLVLVIALLGERIESAGGLLDGLADEDVDQRALGRLDDLGDRVATIPEVDDLLGLAHRPVFLERLAEAVDRRGEAEIALAVGAFGHGRLINRDPQQASVTIDQGAAPMTRMDPGRELHATLTLDGRQHTDAQDQRLVRTCDDGDVLAREDRLGELGRGKRRALGQFDLEQRDVLELVDVQDLGGVTLAGSHSDRRGLGVLLEQVRAGQHQAGRVDDDSGAEGLGDTLAVGIGGVGVLGGGFDVAGPDGHDAGRDRADRLDRHVDDRLVERNARADDVLHLLGETRANRVRGHDDGVVGADRRRFVRVRVVAEGRRQRAQVRAVVDPQDLAARVDQRRTVQQIVEARVGVYDLARLEQSFVQLHRAVRERERTREGVRDDAIGLTERDDAFAFDAPLDGADRERRYGAPFGQVHLQQRKVRALVARDDGRVVGNAVRLRHDQPDLGVVPERPVRDLGHQVSVGQHQSVMADEHAAGGAHKRNVRRLALGHALALGPIEAHRNAHDGVLGGVDHVGHGRLRADVRCTENGSGQEAAKRQERPLGALRDRRTGESAFEHAARTGGDGDHVGSTRGRGPRAMHTEGNGAGLAPSVEIGLSRPSRWPGATAPRPRRCGSCA